MGFKYIDYTLDGLKMAAAQSKLVRDFGIDCLLTCSDPAREVIDIAGDGSVKWYDDQGPAIRRGASSLVDKSRLSKFSVPDPFGGGRMHDRIKGIEANASRVRRRGFHCRMGGRPAGAGTPNCAACLAP